MMLSLELVAKELHRLLSHVEKGSGMASAILDVDRKELHWKLEEYKERRLKPIAAFLETNLQKNTISIVPQTGNLAWVEYEGKRITIYDMGKEWIVFFQT